MNSNNSWILYDLFSLNETKKKKGKTGPNLTKKNALFFCGANRQNVVFFIILIVTRKSLHVFDLKLFIFISISAYPFLQVNMMCMSQCQLEQGSPCVTSCQQCWPGGSRSSSLLSLL